MTKDEYKNLLQQEEWQYKKYTILKRDQYTCQKCGCKTNLHVHHIWYIEGNMPWEVPDKYLITLCEVCHSKEHKGKLISSFIKKLTDKQKKKLLASPKVSKKKRIKNKVKIELPFADRVIQERYDKLKRAGKFPH